MAITFTVTDATGATSQIVVSSPTINSAGVIVISPGSGSFVLNGITYTLAANGDAQGNGVLLAGGSGTGLMALANNTVYGEDAATGSWYTWNGSVWSPASDPRQTGGGGGGGTPTGIFKSTASKILGPDGNPFVFRGIAVPDAAMGLVTPQQILNRHPRCNAIRLVIGDENHGFITPAKDWPTTKAWVDAAIALGLVVVLDDHEQNSGSNVYSGSDLNADLAYAANAAGVYKNQPLVLFQNMNEPGNTTGLSAYHKAFHDEVRGAGNENLIFNEIVGGNLPQAADPSDDPVPYKSMRNWAWSPHFYNWMSIEALGLTNATNQSQVNAWFNQQLTTLIAWTEQSGGDSPGVAILEFGDIDYRNGGDPNVNVNGAFGTQQVVNCALKQNTSVGEPSSGSFYWLLNGDVYQWANSSNLEEPLGTETNYGTYWNANA